jgi:hypothetical protein
LSMDGQLVDVKEWEAPIFCQLLKHQNKTNIAARKIHVAP